MRLQIRKIFLRIIGFIAKAMMGLLLILFTAIAIIHLPSVQKEITRKLSNYLSSKIDAQVSIRGVKFSLLGSVTIEGLTVWDQKKNRVCKFVENLHNLDFSENWCKLFLIRGRVDQLINGRNRNENE